MKLTVPNALKISLPKSLLVFVLLLITTTAAQIMTPKLYSGVIAPDFETVIPKKFGDWQQFTDTFLQVSLSTGGNDEISKLYDRVLTRTYENSKGDRVMLALAYAHEQKQDVKIHRPEVCYIAQGFQKISQTPKTIQMPNFKPIAAQRLLMRNSNRTETVSYWIRIGDDYPTSGMGARWKILRDGLKGKILDGILVRASIALDDEAGAALAYEKQEAFMIDLVNATKQSAPNLLAAVK